MTEHLPQPRPQGRPSPVLLVFLILPLLGLVAALLMMLANSGAFAGAPPTPLPVTLVDTSLIDKPAPNFQLTDLDGRSYRLSSYRGRVVFVNFWATWCEPCERELPAFEQFMADQDEAIILAVNVDEPADVITPYLDARAIDGLTVLLDEDMDAYRAYKIDRLPSTFVIDPAGTVRYLHLGEMTLDDLVAYVDELAE